MEDHNYIRKVTMWNKPLKSNNGSVKIQSVIGIDYWPSLSKLANYIMSTC